MSSDAKDHIRVKLQCQLNGAVASARPRESAAIFPKPCIHWSKLCTGQPSFCLPFCFYFSLGCFRIFFVSLLFSFLDKAGVFVGNSIVVPPIFLFFSPCLPCPFVFCLFSFSPFFFFFCIYYKFILAEDLCVHLPLLLISISFSGGFLVKKGFPLF